MPSPSGTNVLLPFYWLRRHFARYQLLRPWQFCWRVTVESLVLGLIVAWALWFFNAPGSSDSPAFINMPFWLAVVIVVAVPPLWETFVFQVLPIAVARRCRARPWLQISVSTALFAIAHYSSNGLSSGICAGVIGGFYLSFCFTTWWPRSGWTALWTTGLSHALSNAIVIVLLVIFCQGWPGPKHDLAMNASVGGWADLDSWYFWKPHGDFAFVILGRYGTLGSISSSDLWATLVVDGVSSPFEMWINNTPYEVSYDLSHHTLTIAGQTFNLQKANAIYVRGQGNRLTFNPRMIKINPVYFDADRGGGYIFAALTVAFADHAKPAFVKEARQAVHDYLQMERRRRVQ